MYFLKKSSGLMGKYRPLADGPTLKGTKRQYSGQMSQIFKTVKTIEIQPVRPTDVCGKV